MKKQIATIVTILSIVGIPALAEINRPLTRQEPLASFGIKDAANGQWTISGRVCGIGINSLNEVQADDAFKLGRDKMFLEIHGEIGLISTTINGQYHNDSFKVDQNDHSIVSLAGDQPQVIYRFEDDGSMTIMTGGFGEGGTCPVGATLFTNFVRY